MSNPTESTWGYEEAEEMEADPLTIDEYLGDDLPDPDRCPYCGDGIQVVETTTRWQVVMLDRDANGDLEVVDYGSQETADYGDDEFYECLGAEHDFPDLEALDREQREQEALRRLVMSAPDHEWNRRGDEPGTGVRVRAIYAAPMFSGRRSCMARMERQMAHRWKLGGAMRWERFLALDPQPESPVDLREVTGVE